MTTAAKALPVDRRAGILDAALAAFAGRGVAAAPYVECLRDYQEGLARMLARNSDAEAGIRGLVRHHLRWVHANRQRAAFLFERREPEVAEASAAEVRALNTELLELVRGWLQPHVDAGVLKPIALQLFYVIVLGPSQAYARHWLRDPERKAIRGAEPVLAQAAWGGVRARCHGGPDADDHHQLSRHGRARRRRTRRFRPRRARGRAPSSRSTTPSG